MGLIKYGSWWRRGETVGIQISVDFSRKEAEEISHLVEGIINARRGTKKFQTSLLELVSLKSGEELYLLIWGNTVGLPLNMDWKSVRTGKKEEIPIAYRYLL